MTAGAVVVDVRAVQSPDHRGRGIGRWVAELAAGLERVAPELVGAYLLDPTWPPPGAMDELLASGKVHYLGTPEAVRAVRAARAYHCASPFELGRTMAQVRPPDVDRLGLRYAVTAFDLIPLLHAGRYLEHPSQRRRYMGRLEVVRAADAVLAISAAAADDVVRHLGVEPRRCTVVGTGVSARFTPPADRVEALASARGALPGLTGPFILFPGGNDPRKNTEGLITAFGCLPADLRTSYQLVVAGDLPHAVVAHYRHLAGLAGVRDRLLCTGFVGDETLLRLYQATDLVAFPSLAEGYGLPAAEGLAAGAVVAVSDQPPFDEIVPDARARFDPADPQAMAQTLARCLTDDSVRRAVRADARATVLSWDTVAARAAAALAPLAGGARRPWRPRARPTLAVVSPLPPVPSGIAGYSAELVAALERVAGESLRVDCFVDGRNRFPVDPEPVCGRVPVDAALFERVDGAIGGYDHVLYVLGNSECHANALAALRRRPGTVLAHEVRLSGLLSLSGDTRGALQEGGVAGAVARNYPGLPGGLAPGGVVEPADAERYGLLLLKEVAAAAPSVLVCSEAARRLAALDVGPALTGRVRVAPYAVTQLTDAEREAVAVWRSAAPPAPPLVASFGIVDPSKRPETVIEAVAALARRGIHVRAALVGPVSRALGGALRSLAATLAVADRVQVTGEVTADDYLRLLGEATVAVQLRDRFSGECSGTVSECLSAGVPTVVARIGWMAEIPSDAARSLPPTCGAGELADTLAALLATPERRGALAAGGARWARRQSFDVAAAEVLEALGAHAAPGAPGAPVAAGR